MKLAHKVGAHRRLFHDTAAQEGLRVTKYVIDRAERPARGEDPGNLTKTMKADIQIFEDESLKQCMKIEASKKAGTTSASVDAVGASRTD